MIKGMTAFAERNFATGAVRLKISIKTLNHRYFDWSYKGTPLGELEGRLRTLCNSRLARGRVEVSLEMAATSPDGWEFAFNEGLLLKVLAAVDRSSRKSGRQMPVSFDGLLRIPQIYELKRRNLTPVELAFVEKSFTRTLDEIVAVRGREGRATVREILVHLKKIRTAVARVEGYARRQPAALKRRFEKKMKDIGGGRPAMPENRVAEEVNLLVQRHDMAEEISRLKMHIEDCARLMSGRTGGPVGKQLDFLSQELTREANTVNSKSPDIRITRECLAVKAEIECIREQAQNLE